MTRWGEETTIKFVCEYIKHQCLWNVKHEHYKNRRIRYAAYLKMAQVMALQDFGIKDVVQKIKNIRSTYSQELKKIRDSKDTSLRTGNKVYTPGLKWFYILDDAIKFGIDNTITMDIKVDETEIVTSDRDELINIDEDIEEDPLAIETEPSTSGSKLNKRKRVEEVDEFFTSFNDISNMTNNSRDESEFELFGRYIGVQLQGMPLMLALQAQDHIQTYITRLRLEYLKKNLNK